MITTTVVKNMDRPDAAPRAWAAEPTVPAGDDTASNGSSPGGAVPQGTPVPVRPAVVPVLLAGSASVGVSRIAGHAVDTRMGSHPARLPLAIGSGTDGKAPESDGIAASGDEEPSAGCAAEIG